MLPDSLARPPEFVLLACKHYQAVLDPAPAECGTLPTALGRILLASPASPHVTTPTRNLTSNSCRLEDNQHGVLEE